MSYSQQSFAAPSSSDKVSFDAFAPQVEAELRTTGAMSQRQLAMATGLGFGALLGVLHTLEIKERITTTRLGLGDRLVMLKEEE